MSDDITFCASKCSNKECFRHPDNIKNPHIPHSFAYLKGTEEWCEEEVRNENNESYAENGSRHINTIHVH